VAACDEFFDDLADLLEHVATYTDLLIIGDINLHLDVRSDPHTIRFQQLLEGHDLTQHVVGATHSLSHTLDVLITRAEQTVDSVSVDPPVLSDHSQIVGVLAARLPHPHTGTRQVCCCWRQLDLDELKHDIQQSVLITDPPADVDEYFTTTYYVHCLTNTYLFNQSLFAVTRSHRGVTVNAVRRSEQPGDLYTLQLTTALGVGSWTVSAHCSRPNMPSTGDQLSQNSDDARALGSRVNSMLSLPADPTTPASTHTVHDFVTFFRHKVEDIRTAMSTATSPDIHV